MGLKMHPSVYVHPGEWLMREVVEPHGLSVTACAAYLSVSRQIMSARLNGRAGLSALMALRFEKAFGISAETMQRMQAGWDLAQARLRAEELKVVRVKVVV